MDLGTGDGRFVLAHARAHPERFVLGVDASPDAMTDASRRAARIGSRGGLPNAMFMVAALEAIPAELDGFANLVTVHFPWGSLRSAAAGHDPQAAALLVRLLRPAARLELLLADDARDEAAPIRPEAVAEAYRTLGLRTVAVLPATVEDAVAAHSSWGKRLLRHPAAGRSAWRIRLERPSAGSEARD